MRSRITIALLSMLLIACLSMTSPALSRAEAYEALKGVDAVKVVFDFVNHMTYDRVYNSGEFARSVVGELDDRIGVFHVKDVMVQDVHLVCHIDETPLGTGVLDHAAIIEASRFLEPWKTFSLEHFNQQGVPREEQWRQGYEFIQGVARRMGHEWTSQHCTRERWTRGEFR